MCHGLVVKTATVFDTVAAAEAYLETVMVKGENLIAVPALKTFTATEAQRAADSAYQALKKEYATVEPLIWHFHRHLLNRAKAGKSAFKTCPDCKSKISVSHLDSAHCPVCRGKLLETPSDTKKLEGLVKKRDKIKEKLQARDAALVKKHANGKLPDPKIWVVGGLCAS